MEKWMRLPADDAAGTNTNDTTEVQIGTGLSVPSWAKSIKALHTHLIYLALTTKQTIAGYIRAANDENTIDPLNFPLPLVTALTGAIGTHVVENQVTIPVEASVEGGKGDTLRLYAALDESSTGVHTIQGYVLFSSDAAEFEMHAEKTASTAGSATANTKGTVATLSTLANRCSRVLGFWNYVYSYPTVDQTCGGYVSIESSVPDWQKQEIPTNTIPSGLSTQVTPFTKPVFAGDPKWLLEHGLSGYTVVPFKHGIAIPNKAKSDFKLAFWMDGTNTVAPAGRMGIIYKE
jgi:hypothetical protein